MRRSTAVRLLSLTTSTAAVAALLAAGVTSPAYADAPTAKQRAAYFAADRGHPVVPARTSAGHAAAALPRYDAAKVSAMLAAPTVPTLLYTQAAFASPTTISETIVARNLVTGSITALMAPSTGICPFEARLSPDASKVVYLDYGASCTGVGRLTTYDTATKAIQSIATPPSDAFFQLPNWSPDSSKILYTTEQDDSAGNFITAGLFTLPAAGGSPTPLTGGGAAAYDGVYSPDGTQIAYAPTEPPTADYLAVMNANGTGATNLLTTEISNYSPIRPAWSPDGNVVVFQYYKNMVGPAYSNALAVVHVDDSSTAKLPVTLATNSTAYFGTWSSDGTEIFYDANLLDAKGDAATNDAVYATDPTGHRRATVVSDAVHAYGSPFYTGPGLDTGSASTFTPVAPVRVQPKVTVGPGGTLDVLVSGSAIGLPAPAGATAVTLNLTGVSPTNGTYLQAYPKPAINTAVPLVSNLNLSPGQIAAVAVQVAVSSDGYVRIRNNAGSTGVIVDVSGYFMDGSGANQYSPISPVRAIDTTLGEGATTDVTVTGLGSVPGLTPVAVVLNLTGASPTKGTYLTVYPTPAIPTDPPVVSNLNLARNTNRANLVTVPIGDAGKITIRNAFGSVRAIADVVGFYGTGATGGLAYYSLQPTRFMDTRYGTDTSLGSTAPLGPGGTIAVGLRGSATTSVAMITVPATAQAFVYNLTAVAPSGNTYLTAYPYGGTRPLSSSVNAGPGTIVPNLAITGGNGSGQVGIYNFAGKTPIIIDLAGYYAP